MHIWVVIASMHHLDVLGVLQGGFNDLVGPLRPRAPAAVWQEVGLARKRDVSFLHGQLSFEWLISYDAHHFTVNLNTDLFEPHQVLFIEFRKGLL